MNDRYLYLPCIIVFAMAAGALQRLTRSLAVAVRPMFSRGFNVVPLAAVAAAIAACLIVVDEHLPVWRDSDSLWAHTMQKVPHLPVVRIQLALTLRDSGRTDEALRVLRAALQECQPDELDRERMVRAVEEWSAVPPSGIRKSAPVNPSSPADRPPSADSDPQHRLSLNKPG